MSFKDQKNRSLRNNNLKLIEIDVVVLTILLYLFRTTVPFLKFPFIVLFFFLLFYSSIKNRIHILPTLKGFFTNFYLAIIIAIILIVSFLFSNKLYLMVFKDIINSIILILLYFLMTIYIKSKSEFNLFLNSLIWFFVFFALLVSILLINIFFNVFPDVEGSISSPSIIYSLIGTLSEDYNFALIPVYLGMVSVLYILTAPCSFFKKGVLNLILIIFSITIVFSGSRRGIIVFAFVIISLVVIQLFSFLRKEKIFLKMKCSSKWFLISITTLGLLFIGFVFILPVNMKRVTLDFLGINIRSYKQVISTRLFKYANFLSNTDYNDFRTIIWPDKLDPRYPDSGWGSRLSTMVFPLFGENVEIVPKNSIGYLMDNTCNVSSWNNNAYSFTNISSLFQGDSIKALNEFYYASVYCFVSKDFDGSWARISAERRGGLGNFFINMI